MLVVPACTVALPCSDSFLEREINTVSWKKEWNSSLIPGPWLDGETYSAEELG